jgi:hypothetical protein
LPLLLQARASGDEILRLRDNNIAHRPRPSNRDIRSVPARGPVSMIYRRSEAITDGR